MGIKKLLRKTLLVLTSISLMLPAVSFSSLASEASDGQKDASEVNAFESNVLDSGAPEFESAYDAAYSMKIGWNVGNSLDCFGLWINGDAPDAFECAWGNPKITRELIHAVREAGFSSVRVPVTYSQKIDENGNIRTEWLNRVEEVVNYVLDEGMYCIINVHHDTGEGETAWMFADASSYEQGKNKFANIWKQVADRFSSYGDHLLFEGYNEILDENHSWNVTDSEGYTVLNQWAQLFVDTVRSTGGNNAFRNLIVTTYSADAGKPALENFVFPSDSSKDHLIAGLHIYEPPQFSMSESDGGSWENTWTDNVRMSVDEQIDNIKTYLLDKDIPAFISEFGCQNKNNTSDRVEYVKYMTQRARALGMSAFWWDDGRDESMKIIDRQSLEWTFPEIRDALVDAVAGETDRMKESDPDSEEANAGNESGSDMEETQELQETISSETDILETEHSDAESVSDTVLPEQTSESDDASLNQASQKTWVWPVILVVGVIAAGGIGFAMGRKSKK